MEKSNLAIHERPKPEESACSLCKYAVLEKSKAIGAPDVLQCRRYPPQAHPVMQMTPQGPQLLGTFTVYPNAMALCGEFLPVVAIAAGMGAQQS